jgi:hypothetical protein
MPAAAVHPGGPDRWGMLGGAWDAIGTVLLGWGT